MSRPSPQRPLPVHRSFRLDSSKSIQAEHGFPRDLPHALVAAVSVIKGEDGRIPLDYFAWGCLSASAGAGSFVQSFVVSYVVMTSPKGFHLNVSAVSPSAFTKTSASFQA